jgi:hypothetical protein
MIRQDDKDRIIGDFMECNANITYYECTSEVPKFIRKIIVKNQRKKLVKSLNKFVSSDYILTRNNLYEAFVFFYNDRESYTPENIKIYKSEENEDNRIECLITLTDIICLIHIDDNSEKFDIALEYHDKETDKISKLTAQREVLDNANGPLQEQVSMINTYLKASIGDFILWQIERFMEA